MPKKDNTALLIMDVQPGIVDRLSNKAEYMAKVEQALDFAHQQHYPVLFVVVGFREGLPEISPNNQSFAAFKTSGQISGMINPSPAIKPQAKDILIVKKRFSAFSGSDLELVLRAQNISSLVLGGISTSGVVLSTVREAADKDYALTVISDLCADPEPEVNRILFEKVFPRQANVISLSEWISNAQ
jgi:nicotinamidase-related amidase